MKVEKIIPFWEGCSPPTFSGGGRFSSYVGRTNLIVIFAIWPRCFIHRQFLWSFRLPGEAQKIDRMMEAFANWYCQCNPGVFQSTGNCEGNFEGTMLWWRCLLPSFRNKFFPSILWLSDSFFFLLWRTMAVTYGHRMIFCCWLIPGIWGKEQGLSL